MIVKLLTEYYFEFLSLKGGCRGSSESTPVKMSNCWKSHAVALILYDLKLLTLVQITKGRERIFIHCCFKMSVCSSMECDVTLYSACFVCFLP